MCILGIGAVAIWIIFVGTIVHICRHWGEWHDDNFGYAKGERKGIHYD